MDSKEELQAKRKELFHHSEETLSRIKDLDKLIADSEVTYSIGDRFVGGVTQKKYLLCERLDRCVGLTCLLNGRKFGNGASHSVGYMDKINKKEMFRITNGGDFTRYWDNRKQCKV